MNQKYVHKGVRLQGGKKVASLQLLDENNQPTGDSFTTSCKSAESGLIGYIFEAAFDMDRGNVVGLKRSAFDAVGNLKDHPAFPRWVADQVRALAKSKHTTVKNEYMSDLCNRLHNERIAMQAALDRGDYESAQAIKDLVLLALDKKIKHNESEKYTK